MTISLERTHGTLLLALDETNYTAENLASIRQLVPQMPLLVTTDRAQIEAARDDIEIAVGHVPVDLLVHMPRLRWVQQWFAGADWLRDYPAVAEKDFILTNSSGVHAVPISEHIFAFLLAFTRRFHQAMRRQLAHEWQSPEWDETIELADKTMLLIGVGASGTRTAAVASSLGMNVIGIRRHPTSAPPNVSAMHPPDRLLDLLPRADFVVSTVPSTTETYKMIGENELRAMKPSAILVNVGRGETIDEEALIRALNDGWIAGVGLDVFESEPLPQESPLWQMENVIITAHYAGKTSRYDERAFRIFLDNLRRYRAGYTLHNIVHKELGY